MKGIIDTEKFYNYEASDGTTDASGEGNAISNQVFLGSDTASDEEADEFDFDELEAKLEGKIAEELSELEFLEEEREKIGNPDALGKVILDEVWKQFGNQIGLDLTNETLIQEYDRTHPNESAEYNAQEGAKILNDPKYKAKREEMKRQQAEGKLKDDYTGKDLKPGDDFDVEHVVKRKEIFENQRRKQAGLEAAELANKDENMKAVNDSLNRSIKEKTNKEYVESREQREKDLIAQNERAKKKIDESNMSDAEKRAAKAKADKRLQNKLDADDDLMMEADAQARKAINKDIAKGAVKQTAKKAGKDALKAMAVSSLFALLKEVMNGLIRFLKSKSKSFKLFLEEMKNAIKGFFKKITSVLQTGASSAIGSILSEIFGPIVSTFKKLASLIKQGVTSVMDAVRYLADKENKNKPFSIKVAQVGKIITAGLVAGGAIFLGELFEALLMEVPGMQTPIPLLGTLANIIGMFLASLVSGLVGAIIINLIDKFIAKRQKRDALDAQIEQGNVVLALEHKLRIVSTAKMENDKANAMANMGALHAEAAEVMRTTIENIKANSADNEAATEAQHEVSSGLDNLLEDMS